jgi:cell fate (sporulation/competence/biofilm development) regulator YlbF (YheA/YmcA/DUF963 family)
LPVSFRLHFMIKYVVEVSKLLATTEGVQLLEKTDQLSAMILQSDIVERYHLCRQLLTNNQESQRKIDAFTSLKEQYEEVQRFGKYHPDYQQVMIRTRELKREMDLDPSVIEFKKAEDELQCLLDEISVIIGHSVSKNIKVPTGNPYFDSLSGCGGSCGTGGSCGCSSK